MPDRSFLSMAAVVLFYIGLFPASKAQEDFIIVQAQASIDFSQLTGQFTQQVTKSINAIRAERGLDALEVDTRLSVMATEALNRTMLRGTFPDIEGVAIYTTIDIEELDLLRPGIEERFVEHFVEEIRDGEICYDTETGTRKPGCVHDLTAFVQSNGDEQSAVGGAVVYNATGRFVGLACIFDKVNNHLVPPVNLTLSQSSNLHDISLNTTVGEVDNTTAILPTTTTERSTTTITEPTTTPQSTTTEAGTTEPITTTTLPPAIVEVSNPRNQPSSKKFSRSLVAYLNRLRAGHHLPPLQECSHLHAAAQNEANIALVSEGAYPEEMDAAQVALLYTIKISTGELRSSSIIGKFVHKYAEKIRFGEECYDYSRGGLQSDCTDDDVMFFFETHGSEQAMAGAAYTIDPETNTAYTVLLVDRMNSDNIVAA